MTNAVSGYAVFNRIQHTPSSGEPDHGIAPTITTGLGQLASENVTQSLFKRIMVGVGSCDRLATLFQQYSVALYPLGEQATVRSILQALLDGWHQHHAIDGPTHLDLGHLNLSGVDGSQLDFSHTDLSFTNLTAATLRNANFTHTRCVGTNLTRATLYGANIHQGDWSTANLDNAQAQRAVIDHINLEGALMVNTVFNFATVTHCDMTNATATQSEWIGATLVNNNLTNTDFTQATFDRAYCHHNTMANTKWGEAQLRGTYLGGALLTSAQHLTHHQLVAVEGEPVIGVALLAEAPSPDRKWIVEDSHRLSDQALRAIDLTGNWVCPSLYQRMISINHPSIADVNLAITPDNGVAPPPADDAFEQAVKTTLLDKDIRVVMAFEQPTTHPQWTSIWSHSLWSQALLSHYDSYNEAEKEVIIQQVASELLTILDSPDESDAATIRLATIVGNIPPTHTLWKKIMQTLPTDVLCQIEDRIISFLPVHSPYLNHIIKYCCDLLVERDPSAHSILPTLASLNHVQLTLLDQYLSPQQVVACHELCHLSNLCYMMVTFTPATLERDPLKNDVMTQLGFTLMDPVPFTTEGIKCIITQRCGSFPGNPTRVIPSSPVP